MVWPEEWGPRKAGSVHIDCDVWVSHGRLRVVGGTVAERVPSRHCRVILIIGMARRC